MPSYSAIRICCSDYRIDGLNRHECSPLHSFGSFDRRFQRNVWPWRWYRDNTRSGFFIRSFAAPSSGHKLSSDGAAYRSIGGVDILQSRVCGHKNCRFYLSGFFLWRFTRSKTCRGPAGASLTQAFWRGFTYDFDKDDTDKMNTEPRPLESGFRYRLAVAGTARERDLSKM